MMLWRVTPEYVWDHWTLPFLELMFKKAAERMKRELPDEQQEKPAKVSGDIVLRNMGAERAIHPPGAQ